MKTFSRAFVFAYCSVYLASQNVWDPVRFVPTMLSDQDEVSVQTLQLVRAKKNLLFSFGEQVSYSNFVSLSWKF